MSDTDNTVWLTQAAYDRLQAELEHLRTEGRASASAAIEEARSHGDLRENAEYDTAKEEQGKMEARIRQLEDTLSRAQVGEAPKSDTVQAGMIVKITDEDGDTSEFLLGSREDRPEGVNVVSAQSPLGKALIGAKVGQTVTCQAPQGSYDVTVDKAKPYKA